ncbi:MAG TPA: TetR/AcrR family transcriptional regulator [Salinimicrobium sp.]|nr:TetR/AcrR family transcriptional regulator [Salinimicrobium sp.]
MKEKILQKATDLFLSHGFKSVTMDEIANELGISKKTIYEHFATKTKLVEATTMRMYTIISEGIDTICALDRDPIEELYEIKKFVMSRLKGEKASPIFQLHKYYPEIFQEIKRMQFEKMQDCVLENLQKGIKKGVYRQNLNLGFVARIYFLGMNGIKDESIFPRNEFSSKEIHEEFLSYHLRGIVTPKGLEKLNQILKNGH